MTKTIKEIEEKFYETWRELRDYEGEMFIQEEELCEKYDLGIKIPNDMSLEDYMNSKFREEKKEEEIKKLNMHPDYLDLRQRIKMLDKIKREKLEKVVVDFSDNDDDLVTAFAGYITFAINNIKEITYEDIPYPNFLFSALDRIIYNKSNESDNLKAFLRELIDAVCNNDYNKMQLLYYKYDYSVTSLYIFCYYMYLYSQDIENKELFNSLIMIYRRMNDDMSDYVLNLGIYDIQFRQPPLDEHYLNDFDKTRFNILSPFQLFPFCYMYSKEYWANQIINLEEDLKNIDYKKYPNSGKFIEESLKEEKKYAMNQITEDNLCKWSYEPITRNDINKMHTLHIPTILPNMNIFKKLLKASAELEQTNISLMKSQENRKRILNSFSHRYKNMKTNSLYKVANALLKMDSKELKKHGRTVLLEYGIKENLKKEVDILQLQFEDNSDKLKEKIQNSTQQQNSQDNFSISEIINNVIKKCIITLVHDGGDESKAIRKFCFKDYDLISIRNSFEENVLFEENINPVTWFKENIAHNFEVTISPFWKEIFFKKHDYADNVISDLLTDMLMNALKYADKTQNIQFDLDEDDNFMIIRSRNTTVKDKTNIPSSGIGLESQNDLLNALNKSETNLNNSITFGEADGIFSIKVRISKNLVRRNEDV